VAQSGFSRSTVRPFRVTVVITPAVRERTDATVQRTLGIGDDRRALLEVPQQFGKY